MSCLKLSTFLSISFCGNLLWIHRPRLLMWLSLLPFLFFSRTPCSLQAEPPYTDLLDLLLLPGWRNFSFSLSDVSLSTPFIVYSLIGWCGAGNYISPWINGCLGSLLCFLKNIPQNKKLEKFVKIIDKMTIILELVLIQVKLTRWFEYIVELQGIHTYCYEISEWITNY